MSWEHYKLDVLGHAVCKSLFGHLHSQWDLHAAISGNSVNLIHLV